MSAREWMSLGLNSVIAVMAVVAGVVMLNSSIDAKIANIDTKISDLGTKVEIANVDTKISDLGTKVDTMRSEFDHFNGEMAGMCEWWRQRNNVIARGNSPIAKPAGLESSQETQKAWGQVRAAIGDIVEQNPSARVAEVIDGVFVRFADTPGETNPLTIIVLGDKVSERDLCLGIAYEAEQRLSEMAAQGDRKP